MKKNQLLKSVSNVNDAASQVVSPTKGMDGKIKDISVKNGTKNVESIAEKAFKDAITNKTNIDTTNNGQFHTAFNAVDSTLTSSVKVGAALNHTTKKIAITLAISLINKYQTSEKREAFSTGDGHVSASTELQTLYAQEKNGNFDRGSNSSVVRSLDENNLDVSYKKIGNASASVDGEFINCDVLDSNILVVNYNDKMIECQLKHSISSDTITESDINMSTVVVSNQSHNMSITSTVDNNASPTVLNIASDIYAKNVLAASNAAKKPGEISESTNIEPINDISNLGNLDIGGKSNVEVESYSSNRIESDINTSTVVVPKQDYNMSITSTADNNASPTVPDIVSDIYAKNVLAASNAAKKSGEISESKNIKPINDISNLGNLDIGDKSNAKIESYSSDGLVSMTNNVSPGNINNIVEKNKIKRTNISDNIMNSNMKLLASDVVAKNMGNKSTELSDDKLKALKYKLINKRKKLDKKHKSSKVANDFNRRVRKSIVNNAINASFSQTENNMSTGMAAFAGDFVASQAKRKAKELTVDKLYNATVGKVMDKIKNGVRKAFAGMAKAIIHFAFMLFQLIVSVIGTLAALISPIILLPAIIGAVLIGGVFGGIFYIKVNDEQAAKNDSDIRQVIEENEDLFGRFSLDKSNASLGTYQKSYDELKSVFTWMNDDNPYPVMDQAKMINSQYTLHRTDVEGHGVHYGVDFYAPMNSVLVAIADATVEATNTDSGYGNHVILNFGDGTYALYGHMTDFVVDDSDNPDNLLGWKYLEPGDTVKAGEPIGHSGSTGDSTGPHLHLVLSTSPYGGESDSRYDFNEYVKAVWCPDYEFSYDYEQTYGIFEDYADTFKEN